MLQALQGLQSLATQAQCGPLPYPSRPLGVWPFHCQHQNTVPFKIRERFGIGDSFSVHEATTNQECFKIAGKLISIHARKDMYDTSGNHLCHFSKRLISLTNTYAGEAPDGSTLFEIKQPIIKLGIRTRLTVEFNNVMAGGQKEVLEVYGDFFNRAAEVLHNGQTVAQIGRSFLNFNQVFSDRQTYILTVAPNVDAALMVAICIALEQKRQDEAAHNAQKVQYGGRHGHHANPYSHYPRPAYPTNGSPFNNVPFNS